jgi:hypothetical protein
MLIVEAPGTYESPWLGQFQLDNGTVISCLLRNKADGRVVLANDAALQWLTNQGKLAWHMEGSTDPLPQVSPSGRLYGEPSGELPATPTGRPYGGPSGELPASPSGRPYGEPSGELPASPSGRPYGGLSGELPANPAARPYGGLSGRQSGGEITREDRHEENLRKIVPLSSQLRSIPQRTPKGQAVPANAFASREHRQVFTLVDGQRTIEEIAYLLHRPPDAIIHVLQELRGAGFIA